MLFFCPKFALRFHLHRFFKMLKLRKKGVMPMQYGGSYDNEGFVPAEINDAWQSYNANPKNNRVGDCTVRAISKVTGKDWYTTYVALCLQGFRMADLPSANSVWGAYLRQEGFDRSAVPNTCPDCYTVRKFCSEHPTGEYVLALDSHIVAVIDGEFFDTWNSGDEIVNFYWERKK